MRDFFSLLRVPLIQHEGFHACATSGLVKGTKAWTSRTLWLTCF